jgi:hypothetical protein
MYRAKFDLNVDAVGLGIQSIPDEFGHRVYGRPPAKRL